MSRAFVNLLKELKLPLTFVAGMALGDELKKEIELIRKNQSDAKAKAVADAVTALTKHEGGEMLNRDEKKVLEEIRKAWGVKNWKVGDPDSAVTKASAKTVSQQPPLRDER